MPRNGSGVYSKPAGTDPTAFTTIESAKYIQLTDDFSDEITASLPRAGTAAMTGDLNMGSNDITACVDFTCTGITSTAPTSTVIVLSDTAMDLQISDFVRNVNNDLMVISGGSSGTNGCNLRMFGGNHATLASDFQIRDGSNVKLSLDASVDTNVGQFTFTAVPRVPVHTVANAPDASAMQSGAVIFVSNGDAGAATLAVSNGTNWKVVSLGATIST